MTGEAPAAFYEKEGYRVEAWPADPDQPRQFDVFCEGELVGEVTRVTEDGVTFWTETGDIHGRSPSLRNVLAGIAWEIARDRRVSPWNQDERDEPMTRAQAQAELSRRSREGT